MAFVPPMQICKGATKYPSYVRKNRQRYPGFAGSLRWRFVCSHQRSGRRRTTKHPVMIQERHQKP